MSMFSNFKENTNNFGKKNSMEDFKGEVFELDPNEYSNGMIELSRRV